MARRPHIIIFNPDEMRGDALAHLGNPASITPNLDAFAANEAVSFGQAYCQNPVCVPSRCSFFTGLYPHVRGHRTMSQLMYISNVAQQYLRCSMAFYLDDKLPVPKMPDLWEKLLHMQGENVTLRSGVFRLKEAPRQPHIFRVPQIRTWSTLLKDGYPEAVKQEAMTLLDEMSARGEMNADSLRSFYQDFMQMIYFTVGGSEEKIHELFYQPEALELYRNGMKSVDEMKALIRYVTSSWTEHKSVDESKELLDKLKQYIDEHLESELRRDELAEYVHLNPDYLTRLMKKQTGYSLKEYVTRRKMETARTLLRTTTLPVGFIAAKLGYNNFSHFSYTYKKIMDVTPQEERHTEEK